MVKGRLTSACLAVSGHHISTDVGKAQTERIKFGHMKKQRCKKEMNISERSQVSVPSPRYNFVLPVV
jgi:hypothetical protein